MEGEGWGSVGRVGQWRGWTRGQPAVMRGGEPRELREELRSQRSVDLSAGGLTSAPLTYLVLWSQVSKEDLPWLDTRQV